MPEGWACAWVWRRPSVSTCGACPDLPVRVGGAQAVLPLIFERLRQIQAPASERAVRVLLATALLSRPPDG
jgi:hypothetical protein